MRKDLQHVKTTFHHKREKLPRNQCKKIANSTENSARVLTANINMKIRRFRTETWCQEWPKNLKAFTGLSSQIEKKNTVFKIL
jgi:hypothetical protein